ncbi:MAG TPA: T9SS type A sorting domain-containing protein [bacterium]|nr:T9SS type A sorting domain-containing protein [bacterium]HPT29734.1 T9SS type A sorting domain-containing protein [bacterium]
MKKFIVVLVMLLASIASSAQFVQMDTWYSSQGKALFAIAGVGNTIFATGSLVGFVKFDGVDYWPFHSTPGAYGSHDIAMAEFGGNIVGVGGTINEEIYEYNQSTDSWTWFKPNQYTFKELNKSFIFEENDYWIIGKSRVFHNDGSGWVDIYGNPDSPNDFTGAAKSNGSVFVSSGYTVDDTTVNGRLFKVSGTDFNQELELPGEIIQEIIAQDNGNIFIITRNRILDYNTAAKTYGEVFTLPDPDIYGCAYHARKVENGSIIMTAAWGIFSNLGGWHQVSGLLFADNIYVADEHHIYFVSVGSVYLYDQVSGVMEEVGEEINAYPNPTSDRVYINEELENAKILDISGNEVLIPTFTDGKTVIDLSNLPAGMYFLKATLNDQLFTKKLIKQ